MQMHDQTRAQSTLKIGQRIAEVMESILVKQNVASNPRGIPQLQTLEEKPYLICLVEHHTDLVVVALQRLDHLQG